MKLQPHAPSTSRPSSRLFAVGLALGLLSGAASAGTHYVDTGLLTGANDGSTWADAYQGTGGLQAALGASSAGDSIYVAQGTYLPTATSARGASFRLKTGVEVYGGFLGTEASPADRPAFGTAPSILSGDLLGNDAGGSYTDNSYHVVNGASASSTAVLDGFTVRGGNANGSGDDNKGGGILCLSSSSPTVRSCHFIDNRCTFGGAAGYIRGSAPSFVDVTFEDGHGGSYGGAFDIAQAGAVRYDRCLFRNNTAARAGALEIFSTSGVVVTNCVFEGNTATGGSGGGGLWIGSGGSTQLRSCTIVGNTATSHVAAGLSISGASVSVANCIFWDNTGPGGAQNAANQLSGGSATYSLVQGGLAGTGNLSGDPAFTAPGLGDYSLLLSSPAIDAGSNSMVPAGITLDHAHGPRFVDEAGAPDTGAGVAPLVDIGAYESNIAPIVSYCYGDGLTTPCPCNNNALGENGCSNSVYFWGCRLSSTGVPSLSNDTFRLLADFTIPYEPGLFIIGDDRAAGAPFGDGLLCVGGSTCRVEIVFGDQFGGALSSIPLSSACAILPGEVKRVQWWYRDPIASPCGTGYNTSNALEVTWVL